MHGIFLKAIYDYTMPTISHLFTIYIRPVRSLSNANLTLICRSSKADLSNQVLHLGQLNGHQIYM
jgi:hypothetical protein